LKLTLGCRASAPRHTWWQDTPEHRPPEESIARGERGGGGREALPHCGPHGTHLWQGRCCHDRRCRHCQAFASRQCSQRRRRGCPWTLMLPTSCRCAAAAVAAAAAAVGVSVCVGVRHPCCCHCHGGNLAVIVATSAAVATAIGGGRTCMIAS
jgi:hypothetical protein